MEVPVEVPELVPAPVLLPVLVTPPPVDELLAAAVPVLVSGPAPVPVEVEVTARPVLEPAEVEGLLLLPHAASAVVAKAKKAIFFMGYPFRAAADWRIKFGESWPRPWFDWLPNKLPTRAVCKSRRKESCRAS